MQSYSKHALTKEKDLQGKKEDGVDTYTGTYTATYDGFNGKEFIFGGTSLERDNGNCLQVTYKLSIIEGTAELNWITGNDEYTIVNDSSENTKEYTISPGDNYIVLKGENFSGSLELTVEDAEDQEIYCVCNCGCWRCFNMDTADTHRQLTILIQFV